MAEELKGAEKMKADNERQGKKAHTKKKAGRLTRDEAYAELKRLARGGHEQSKYYRDILKAHPVLESLMRKEIAA